MHFPGRLLAFLRVFLCLLLVSTGLAAQPPARAVSPVRHVLEGFGRGTIALEGPWQFRLGDDQRWAAPDFNDASWEQLTADKPWGSQGHPAVTGFGWYRYHIAVRPDPGAPKDLVLLIPRVSDAYEVYWNGRLVGSEGQLPPHARWYVDHQERPANIFNLGAATDGVLAVRVWKAPLFSFDDAIAGGFRELPVVGDAADIAGLRGSLDFRWLSENQFRFAEAILYAIVVLVGLFLWIRNPRETLPLWMAGFAAEVPAAVFLDQLRLPISGVATIAWQQPMFAIQDLCLWLLLLRLLHLSENRRLARFVQIAAWVSFSEGILDGVI
ncbi:MAG TPA: GGDEF domain-containing protein, partial [Terracidiphilus sp.]|nr:GGDEF domain-containing protein [Terracidiphilus sp.]